MSTNTVPGTAGGTHVAGAPLTTKVTEEIVPSLLRNAIDDRIVRVRPTSTPVDQISRCLGSRSCSSMTVEYYSVDAREACDFLDKKRLPGSITRSDIGNFTIELEVTNSRIFAPTDTIMLPDVLVDGTPFTAYVAYISGDILTVYVLNESTGDSLALPQMDKGTKIVRMGRAATELDVQTGQYQALPHKRSNNCQIFKVQVEQSTLQKIAGKEVDWNFTDQEEAAIIDMRLGMEKNFLFGTRARITSLSGNEHVYLTGGIWNQTKQSIDVNINSLNENSLLDICARVFTGNNGSKKRILMGGTGLILALNKLQFSRAVLGDQSLTRWGIRFREIVSNFGTLYVVHSEIFDMCGHYNDGFILDPDYVTKYCHIPFSKERIDLRRAGDRNTDAIVLTEASCIVLRHPDVHFRLIGSLDDTAVETPDTGNDSSTDAPL